MKIDIEFCDNKNSKTIQKIVEEETQNFFSKNSLNDEATISFHFVSKTKIQDLNQKFRHKNSPTDVLSFPIWHKITDIPQTGVVNLGDVFIQEKQIEENAAQEGKAFEVELRFIINHSLNHIIGIHH